MIQKLKTSVMLIGLAFGLVIFAVPVMAAPALTGADCASGQVTIQKDVNGNEDTTCVPLGAGSCNSANDCLKQSGFLKDLQDIVNALAAGVGVVVVGSVIVGGIQYIIAGDNPGGVTEAKKRITNGLLALGVFILSYAFLQWLIPGGIFG